MVPRLAPVNPLPERRRAKRESMAIERELELDSSGTIRRYLRLADIALAAEASEQTDLLNKPSR